MFRVYLENISSAGNKNIRARWYQTSKYCISAFCSFSFHSGTVEVPLQWIFVIFLDHLGLIKVFFYWWVYLELLFSYQWFYLWFCDIRKIQAVVGGADKMYMHPLYASRRPLIKKNVQMINHSFQAYFMNYKKKKIKKKNNTLGFVHCKWCVSRNNSYMI